MKKVTLKMTLEEAHAALLVLCNAQEGYTDGPATPDRILKIRNVIANLDKSMEDTVDTAK